VLPGAREVSWSSNVRAREGLVVSPGPLIVFKELIIYTLDCQPDE
jgi:hypothetical protein